ncbi:putative bifunctional diguanylate cyclase/phosphodiesterase [Iodidimonas nitroreducens]|nr:EAL domain-containing protein [Iodidimonas nitroreducens]
MHRAKKRGPSKTIVFAAETNAVRTGQIQLETDLRHAIENGDLELHYQPIIDLENGNSIAFEALTRWHHPIHGPVSPARFIPMAEESGLILPLGRWAMMEACQQLAAWQKSIKNTQNIYVNVNMSAVQLLEDDISRTVAHCLAQSGIEGRNLRLEITESALVANPEFTARCLHEIKELGPTLALDDFGTGYSSLNYLNSFPIDCIKIDQSFVGQVDRDEQSSKIIRIITMLADTLRMSVVAEGIETSEQHVMMRSLGCRYGQGYLFSRPLPKDDATAHLRKQFK